jgi:DNA-binding CsgD family transcriptional regulator
VYDTLSSLEAAEWHRQSATVLCGSEASPGPVDHRRIAAHLLRCEPSGNERFGRTLLGAARLAAEDNSDDEQRYLMRALGEVDDEPTRASILVRLAECERQAGDLASAEMHATEGLAIAQGPAEHLAAVLAAAQSSAASAGVPAVVTMLEAEARAAGDADPEARRAIEDAAAVLRACLALSPGPDRERPAADGPPSHALLAARAAQMVARGTGSAAQVRDLCARALAGAGPRLGAGFSEIADYLASRSAILADAADLIESPLDDGSDDEPALAGLAIRAQLAFSHGELSAAGSDARAALTAAQDLPAGPLALRLCSDLFAVLVLIAIEQGRPQEATAALAGLEASGEAASSLIGSLRVAVALAQSAPEAAAGRAAEVGDERAWLLGTGICWPALAALADQASGDRRSALALASAHLAHARDWGAPSVLGRALTVRASVDPGPGRVQFAEDAVSVLGQTSARLELARARIELGAALRRARRRREARTHLTQGADLAHRCGAVALSERARAELIAVGARPRRAAFTGVGSLTLSELRVARLAAGGLTNREIAQELVVSAKTISSQLTAIYRKLDVHDREALAETMRRDDENARRHIEPKLELRS